MDPKTIELLAGIIFLLIAVVGGGFVIKEIQIPRVPKWTRIISGFLGLIFCILYFKPSPPPPPPPPSPNGEIIHIDKEPDVTIHNVKLIEVLAKSPHKPPRINDRVIIEFTLQNVSNNPIKILETFVAARNPSQENQDFGYSNENKTIQPKEIIKTKAYKIVDVPGTWQFGPCYALDMLVVSEEENLCPSEWRRFPVQVIQ